MKIKTIGIIKGEGIGPDIMDAALACLNECERIREGKFEFINYEGPFDYSNQTYGLLRDFYDNIKKRNGVILRASLYAPLVYRLRRDFNLFYKLVFLKAIPELFDVSPLKKEVAEKVDILLIRDNNCGPYHGEFRLENVSDTREAGCTFKYTESHIMDIANVAFNFSMYRNRKVHLFIKNAVLGEIGKLWIEVFEKVSRNYPDVELEKLPPDSGSAEIMISPERFDVIVALDVEADILSDQLASLLNGSRGVTPSVNLDSKGFGSYQTIHGTGKSLEKKDIASPIAIIKAAAMLLELSLEMPNEANLIRKAIRKVLAKGYRTEDIFRGSYPNHKKVKTREMKELIIKEMKELVKEKNVSG